MIRHCPCSPSLRNSIVQSEVCTYMNLFNNKLIISVFSTFKRRDYWNQNIFLHTILTNSRKDGSIRLKACIQISNFCIFIVFMLKRGYIMCGLFIGTCIERTCILCLFVKTGFHFVDMSFLLLRT